MPKAQPRAKHAKKAFQLQITQEMHDAWKGAAQADGIGLNDWCLEILNDAAGASHLCKAHQYAAVTKRRRRLASVPPIEQKTG